MDGDNRPRNEARIFGRVIVLIERPFLATCGPPIAKVCTAGGPIRIPLLVINGDIGNDGDSIRWSFFFFFFYQFPWIFLLRDYVTMNILL